MDALYIIEVTFQLSEEDYRATEGMDTAMPVLISKPSAIQIANPVTFMVIPLTFDQAFAQGIVPIDRLPPSNPFSPNRAG